MNGHPSNLRKFFLHPVFQRGRNIVNLRDRQSAIHRTMAGSQNFVLYLANMHFVAIHQFVIFARQAVDIALDGAAKLGHFSALPIHRCDMCSKRLNMNIHDGSGAGRRSFHVTQPDRVWAGDMTVIPTGTGWLHLAVMLDLYSRRIIGWAMGNERGQALSLAALQMAIENRRPKAGLLHHSDQGSAYVGTLYQAKIAQLGAIASMSRKGNAYDNAVVESFFGNLKNELVHHRTFATRDQARSEIFDYIEIFYNRQRAHASLQYVSPVDYENSRRVTDSIRPENPG